MRKVSRLAAASLLWLTTAVLTAQETPPAPAPFQAPAQAPAEGTDEESLEQRVESLERKLQVKEEEEKEAAKTKPTVSVGKDGFSLRSADGAFALRLRGYVQLDGRFYFDDEELPLVDTFVVRRARPIVEGTVWKIFDFRIMPDFGGTSSTLFDGYVEGKFNPAFRVRAGKFKPPLSLERLQSATDLMFVERGAANALAPQRDLGVQVGGELAGGKLEYQAGLFNGSVDGSIAENAGVDGKDVDARLFWRPFRNPDAPPDLDLGLGLAASHGDTVGSPGATGLPSYRSTGNATIFNYRSDATAAGTVVADGRRTRLIPQAWLYRGPFGLLMEYTVERQAVRLGADTEDIDLQGWTLNASWVATGERNSFRGVDPRRPWGSGGHGALILGARYSLLTVGDEAFPIFADPAKSIQEARVATLGLSWNLVRNVRWMIEGNLTEFDGGAAAGTDRPDEKTILTRFQVSF